MKLFSYLYLLAAIVTGVAELTHIQWLALLVKPLLMPLVAGYFINAVKPVFMPVHRFTVTALIFSWLGDIALMLHGNTLYFLAGLSAFLMAHIFFSIAFSRVKNVSAPALLRHRPWLLLPLVVYLTVFILVLYPALGAQMRVPVIAYAVIIGTMVTFAINRYRRVSDSSFALVFGGALLFMVSDSLLAINMFLCHGTLFLAGFGIMVTYMAAQYLIAKGMARNENLD